MMFFTFTHEEKLQLLRKEIQENISLRTNKYKDDLFQAGYRGRQLLELTSEYRRNLIDKYWAFDENAEVDLSDEVHAFMHSM